jgi:hypothetical protein
MKMGVQRITSCSIAVTSRLALSLIHWQLPGVASTNETNEYLPILNINLVGLGITKSGFSIRISENRQKPNSKYRCRQEQKYPIISHKSHHDVEAVFTDF